MSSSIWTPTINIEDTQLRADLANHTDPELGASLVGWSRNTLADAITTVGGMLNAQWVNIWEFASSAVQVNPEDVLTWDWKPAIEAAAASGALVVYFPGSTPYYTKSPAVINESVFLIGERAQRGSTIAGSRIDNTGTGDTIVYSNTKVLYDCGIKQLNINSTTGHAINIKYGAARCHFFQNYLYTRATDKSCVAGIYTSGTIGVDWVGTYSCVFEGGEYVVDNVVRTAPIIDFLCAGTVVNENCFRNIWLTQSKGIQAIRLAATVGGVYLTNNRFEGLTFEVCSGGGFLLAGTSHTKISGVSFWDMAAGYDGTLIAISNDTGIAQNRGLLIESFARIGNSLNGAAVDVDLGFSQGTTIINHAAQSVAAAVINFRGRSAVFIGPKNGTMQNDSAVVYLEGTEITAPVFKTKAGNQLRDISANVDVFAPAGSAGLSAVNGASSQRAYLDANTFFGGFGAFLPNVDNQLNLGHTTNRWRNAYIVTITVSGAIAHTGTAGFFGKTPVAQPAARADTTGAALAALETEVNVMKQKMRDLGLMAT